MKRKRELTEVLNVRLSKRDQQRVKFLVKLTGRDKSDVVRESLRYACGSSIEFDSFQRKASE